VAELAELLQHSLGSSYTIGRELGGGGMSRVFLAEDNALGRSVVFKVLLPELAAGVNAERFNREVQLSARLQHPHIVPVLSAGQVDGLPFYVMPFVKGETLRARLARGPMPIPEIVGILADVSKALAYAHADGIVHRDIKPDNILLSGGASTVADFGIAKAIDAAKHGKDSASNEPAESLTSLGTSLGTPAYMAPEQVAGDPNVDHRADIYSIGCVAYEMLTGRSPFAGKSPQQMLAAHVLETPTPIATLRPDAPPSLIALVNRCLEKEPSARPQSASELVTQLETSGTHETIPITAKISAPTRRKVPVLAIVGGLVVLGAAAIVGYRAIYKPAPPTGAVSVAVAPFEVLDPQLNLWKEGMVDVLSRNIDGAGAIRSVPPSASIKKWEGHADRTVATQFGKRLGAQIVVYGQLQPAGRDLVDAKAWVVDVTHDAQPIEIQFRDSSARMDRVTDSLSVRILGAIGRDHGTRIASLGSGSLPAIKAFLQGSQYFRRTQWDSAAAAFREAVSLDSTFGIAYLHLAQAIGWQKGAGDPEGNLANQKAGRSIRPGLSPHDSLFLTAVGHYGRVNARGVRNMVETHAAIAAMQAAVDTYPKDAEAWYMLGDMRYHGDLTVTDREALNYFDHAIAADSDFAPAYIHAIELASRYGADAARKYAEAYLRRDPRDVEGEGIRLAALAINPKTTPQQLQAAIDTLPPRVVQKAYIAIARMPDTSDVAIHLIRGAIGRVSPDSARNLESLLANELSLHGKINEAWALTLKRKTYVISEIAGLGLIPTDSAKKVMVPLFHERNDAFLYPLPFLATIRDTSTLLDATTKIEKAMRSDTSVARQPVINYVVSSMHAYMALARADTTTATKLFASLPDTLVNLPFDRFIAARLVGKADPKRAFELLERHTPSPDLLFTARELERGRLAERTGDKARAVDAYAFVSAAWRNADAPQLRDAAKEARDALQRLDADGRVRAQLTSGAKP
jgi:tetratricopeptide (TPR) repeat protein